MLSLLAGLACARTTPVYLHDPGGGPAVRCGPYYLPGWLYVLPPAVRETRCVSYWTARGLARSPHDVGAEAWGQHAPPRARPHW